jgi:PAS domain S-box-containing protein
MTPKKRIESLLILGLSLVFGILFWIVDSYFEYRFFHQNLSFLLLEGPETFLESLVTKVPSHSLFVRTSFMAAALLGGVLTAFFLRIKSKSDERIRESEEKLRNIFDTARDAIFVFNLDTGKILDANKYACDLYGYARQELLSLKNIDLSAEPEKTMAVIKTEKNWVPLRYQRKKNGDIFPSEITISYYYLTEMRTATVVIRDISERIRAEKEKTELEARLHRAQKMEALGTLAGGVAHDLNNILAALVGYPDLLLMEIPADSPLKNPLLTIKESGQKAAAVVQDLLTLARRGVVATQVVNLNDIVSEYLNSLEFSSLRSSHPDIGFEVNLDNGLLNIMGSGIHLSKTIMNLIGNAVESIDGAGNIRILTRNEYVDKPISGYDHVQQGDYVLLSIVDSGKGMSREDLSRVFEPFYTKKKMGKSGTGLGMAVVWGTVKDHSGYIDMKSAPGEGTRCDIYFPVTREQPADRMPVASLDDFQGTESILVVDDVPEQREIVDKMLTRLGYSVKTVSSGEAAIAYLENHSADLLVLDMIMDPGIDGLETYKQICKLHPGQKAIISSGFSETGRVKEAQQLGAGAYIKKPYVMKALAETVRKELDKIYTLK